MARKSLISVVIPSYNHRHFIGEAINSVFSQQYRPLELIIIDDGSTDGSAEVIKKYIERPPKGVAVEFRARQNQGAHATINEGLALAKGEFLTILNSDDFYEASRLSLLMAAMKKENSELGLTLVRHIDAANKPLSVTHPMRAWYHDHFKRDYLSVGFRLLQCNIAVTTGNLCFSRRLFDRLGGFRDFKIMHDYDFVLRALFYTEPTLVRKELINYRAHGDNTVIQYSHLFNQESTQVALNYFRACALIERPINRKAPCRAYWGNEYDRFWGEPAWTSAWLGADPSKLL